MEKSLFYDYVATSMLLSDEALQDVEKLLGQYPWFALAQQLVLENYYVAGDARFAKYSARAALTAPSREQLYRRLHHAELMAIQPQEASPLDSEALLEVEEEIPFELDLESDIPEQKQEEEERPAQKEKEEEKHTQKLVVTGSDYFAAEEFAINTTLDDPISRFIIDKPKINPYTSPLLGISLEEPEHKPSLEEFDIVTETLAKIYEEQGFYNLAVNAYEKLILLDRKKSAYFAGHIKEIKSKHKH